MTLKLRVGPYYRTRGGEVVGPLRQTQGNIYTFEAYMASSQCDQSWTDDGHYNMHNLNHKHDLVTECDAAGNPLPTQTTGGVISPLTGATYRTRGGGIVGPLLYDAAQVTDYKYFWIDGTGLRLEWTTDGHFFATKNPNQHDLMQLLTLPGSGVSQTFQNHKDQPLVIEKDGRYVTRAGDVTSHLLPMTGLHYAWKGIVNGTTREWTTEGKYNASGTESPFDLVRAHVEDLVHSVPGKSQVQLARDAELERLRRGVAQVFRQDRGW